MADSNYPRTRRLLASAGLVAIVLAGCGTEDYYAAQRIEAEADQTVAQSNLAATQALSETVHVLSAQNAALTNTVTSQADRLANVWMICAIIVGTALGLSAVLAIAIIATRRRDEPQPVVYMLPNSPTHASALLLDDPASWPENRARRRAIAAPQGRYRLTSGR